MMNEKAGEDRRIDRGTSGFTLIEIMLVTVIIGILAGMVVVVFRGQAQDARINRARGDIKSYQTTLELFALKNNDQYPESLQELVQKEFIQEVNRDPWGTPYIYVKPGNRYRNAYDLFSAGPDGAEGTEDDVWLAEEESQ